MTALCDSCKRLRIQLLPDRVDNNEQGIYSGFPHSTTGELLISAQACSLCSLIKESFLRVGHYHIPEAAVEEKLRLNLSTPVLLRAGRREDGKAASAREDDESSSDEASGVGEGEWSFNDRWRIGDDDGSSASEERLVEDDKSLTGEGGGESGARLNSIEVLVAHRKDFMRGRIHLYAPNG